MFLYRVAKFNISVVPEWSLAMGFSKLPFASRLSRFESYSSLYLCRAMRIMSAWYCVSDNNRVRLFRDSAGNEKIWPGLIIKQF